MKKITLIQIIMTFNIFNKDQLKKNQLYNNYKVIIKN